MKTTGKDIQKLVAQMMRSSQNNYRSLSY